MAFQSVPNTMELTVRGVCNSLPVINTFYFETLANYTILDATEIAEAAWDWWVADMAPTYPIAFLIQETRVRGLEFENDIEVTYAPAAVAGTIASNPTPSNVALCVSRRSGLTGRSARGRVYIGPLAQSVLSTDENIVSTTWANSLVAALNELRVLSRILAINAEEVIVSRFNAGAPRTLGVTFPVLSYLATDLRTDSQRGRLL